MQKPNIVFILLDDMGWKDLSCYGSEFYETPNIDRLAEDGMRFTDAYASCPVCSPTRASILTGRYPARLGITNFIYGQERGRLLSVPYLDHLPPDETTVAATLRDSGYSTYHVGKWHLGGEAFYPENHGFDVNVGGCSWGMPRFGFFSPWNCPTLENGAKGDFLTDRLTDEAIRLLRANGDKPFFLNLCFYAVHIPIQAKKEDIIYFQEKARSMGLDKQKSFEVGELFPCRHKRHLRIVRRIIQSDPVYAAMIKRVDKNVGRLMNVLEKLGKKDDTLVLFTSDNGGLATAEGSPTCNAPLSEGKGWMYEGGTREPLLACWPGRIPKGSICSTAVTSTDFFPTLLDAAGIDLLPEKHCDGMSILPLMEDGQELNRGAIFWHYPHYGNQGGTPGASIRDGDWKLIRFFEDSHEELYNLKEDPGEEKDLAAEETKIKVELAGKLSDWQEQIEAKIPKPDPDYVPLGE